MQFGDAEQPADAQIQRIWTAVGDIVVEIDQTAMIIFNVLPIDLIMVQRDRSQALDQFVENFETVAANVQHFERRIQTFLQYFCRLEKYSLEFAPLVKFDCIFCQKNLVVKN